MISRLHGDIDIGGQHDRTGRDAVDAHLGRQFARQRLGQHDQRGLGAAVRGIVLQRLHAVDIDHVQDQAAPPPQLRRSGLGEEQRCAEVGADQILELAAA